MYDNTDLTLPREEARGIDLLKDVPGKLTKLNKTVFENGAVSFTGYLESMKVRVSERAVKVIDSSLCKWYLGDNFQVLSRGDTRQAIEKLGDLLHLPMDRATVTRIDVAQNFIMNYEKAMYFDHLGTLQYFQRFQQQNGLYYSNSTKTLVFYEKAHEQLVKGQTIPELYNGRCVLRYENRYKRRLLQEFNLPELRAAKLYEAGFYCDLVNRWRSNYENIKKINEIQIDYSIVRTKKQFSNLTILNYIKQRGGELQVIGEIKDAYKKGDLNKKQAYDLRVQVEQACKADLLTSSSDVILELNQKVKEAARFYL